MLRAPVPQAVRGSSGGWEDERGGEGRGGEGRQGEARGGGSGAHFSL